MDSSLQSAWKWSEEITEGNSFSSQHRGYECDITNNIQVQSTIEKVHKEMGAPSILINAAGISIDNLLIRYKEEDINRMINTNIMGTISLSRHVVTVMLKGKIHDAAIVNVGSVVGGAIGKYYREGKVERREIEF